jgi:hypothetical protein
MHVATGLIFAVTQAGVGHLDDTGPVGIVQPDVT